MRNLTMAIAVLSAFVSPLHAAGPPKLTVQISPNRANNDGAVWIWKLGTASSTPYTSDTTIQLVGIDDAEIEIVPSSLAASPCVAPKSVRQTVKKDGVYVVLFTYTGENCK